jgi:small-conductance mechanosensitive channel
MTKILDSAERELEDPAEETKKLDEYLFQATKFNEWANDCIGSLEGEEQPLVDQITALGEPVKGESADVRKRRQSLQKQQSEIKKNLAECRVIAVHSKDVIDAIAAYKQLAVRQQMLAKGPNLIQLLRENWEHPAAWIKASKEFVLKNSGLEKPSPLDWFWLILTVGVFSGLGMLIRRGLKLWKAGHTPGEGHATRFWYALAATVQLYAPILLGTSAAAIFFYVYFRPLSPKPFIAIVAFGLPIVFSLLALIHLFLRSSIELRVYAVSENRTARQLSRRLKVLVSLIFVGYLLFSTILSQSLPEPALLLARSVFGAVLILNLIWVFWLITGLTKFGNNIVTRLFFSGILLGALAAEFLGFRNLADYVLRVLVGTLILFGVFFAISALLRELFDSLEEAKYAWQRRFYALLGVAPEKHLPGLVWIRLISTLILWAALITGLMIVWQVPESRVKLITDYFVNGFTIGNIDIVPLRILQAIIVLAVLLTLNSWIRKRFEQNWLTKTRMERGARESMGAITNYLGITIALLIALSIAGMQFTNLALIAGALSVGIGFGLQNVVNNFVSGLILLFERPIRTGDWIVVGDVEGYVKQISIRSTRIETFDRADVIVPNSDLISGRVTNWMLRSTYGRAKIPVGVAYGSDTAKVKDILLNVANEHPDVLTSGVVAPEPRVLFRQFGDSSLDFELRVYVRDIDRRLSVISDLNFAIDNAFRENGVEIPFPQRDLHVRDWPGEDEESPGQARKLPTKRERSKGKDRDNTDADNGEADD